MSYARTALFIALSSPTTLFCMATSFFDDVSPYSPTTPTTYKNPLHNLAIYQEESLATLKALLVEKKYAVNEEVDRNLPLTLAISCGNSAAITLLLKNGANPDQIFDKSSPCTILSWCITFGKPKITPLLIHNGANPNLATKSCHPLFSAVEDIILFKNKGSRNLAILLRAGANPLAANLNEKTIFQHMKCVGDQLNDDFRSLEPSDDLYAYCKKLATDYQKAGRALVQYKILFNHLHINWCLPEGIARQILTFVDFGLDDYHDPIAKCSICYEEKKFSAIPCSANKHPDSICSECIDKLTNCPLCRKPLKK